ncbi:metabolite traffic protein EboE [Yinghuangia soli]|uniref:Metabolite traffic protein EboE n=1 Tax=Yinghuangia soli TaxID=2908204 RepID=A0AA41PV94_9ACTN|nr:metabolite traffic protein EboE [Yinghuangia soli]MCF2525831.1 metabolite traffic protein EboE [Yinghuangia soli]
MRFRHPDGTPVHVAYCTNVYAATDLPGIVAQLTDYCVPVRKELGSDLLGVGLWLAPVVAEQLAQSPAAVDVLRGRLADEGLEVVTLDAFPYSGEHDETRAHSTRGPAWGDARRYLYTVDCARVLAGLLPDDVVHGSVSTLPFGWRKRWSPTAQEMAEAMLGSVGTRLAELADRTGRHIRIGLEPEPGYVLESVEEAAAALRGLDPAHFGVCLDTCHLAVGFEDPHRALAALAEAGVPVVKMQAAYALQAEDPWRARRALRRYVEPGYLHQTREAGPATLGVDDLSEALAGGLPARGPWRVHCHVPLHSDPPPPLSATRDVLADALDGVFGGSAALTDHVEVEAYTWPVAQGMRTPDRDRVVAGVAAELDWLRGALLARGLVEGGPVF